MPERSSPCSVRLASSTLLPLLAEATYDGFNSQRRSPHAGACFYGHADLLAATGVAHTGHYATSEFFLASTTGTSVPDAFFVLPLPALLGEPWCWESNWMGYVAVATDEGVAVLGRHDIVVVWRGTVESLEWVNDLDFTPTSAAPSLGPAAGDFESAVVHHGYLSVYTSSDEDSKFNQQRAGPEIRCRCRCRKTPPVKHVELQMHAYMDI